jgi:hypothetical protein
MYAETMSSESMTLTMSSETMSAESITSTLMKIQMFGFVAHLINCGDSTKPKWTVCLPNPVFALNHKTLKQYQMFIDYVEYYIQELNEA